MVIVDSNVLLYAYSPESPHYESSRRWLTSAFAGTEQIGFAWVVVLSFLRMITSPLIFEPSLSMTEAASFVTEWLSHENAVLLTPSRRHWQIMHDLLLESQSKANLVTDAHLAALAIENGAALCSFDRDFRRFLKLRLIIPSLTES